MIAPRNNTITLHFKREQLLYDIKNIAFVEGDVMSSENAHAKHQLQDIGEDGNIDRVTRLLDLAFAYCVEVCYPYSKVPVTNEDTNFDMVTDDTLVETYEYIMELRVPDAFSQTTVTLLERLIHELMVYRVLADWLAIVKPDAAEKWAVKASEFEEQVHDNLNGRCGRVRKFQSPF